MGLSDKEWLAIYASIGAVAAIIFITLLICLIIYLKNRFCKRKAIKEPASPAKKEKPKPQEPKVRYIIKETKPLSDNDDRDRDDWLPYGTNQTIDGDMRR